MKKLFFLFCILCVFRGQKAFSQQQLITATCTITNTPTNGYTITVNGNVFLWTNTPTGNFQIQNSNSIPADTTNLFNALTLADVSGVQQVYYVTPTNEIAFYGLNLTASVSTNWATLVLTTNTATNGWYITGPASGIAVQSVATNMYSQAVSDLDAYSTNPFSPYDIALENYVSIQATQTVTGPKNFAGSISGNVGSLTNGGWTGASLTNGANYGNPFRSPGLGTGSEQFGISAIASNNFAVAFGDLSVGQGISSTAVGNAAQAIANQTTTVGSHSTATLLNDSAFGDGASAVGPTATSIGASAGANAQGATAIGTASSATALDSTALGISASTGNANSTAVGAFASTTANHQVALGSSSESVWIPGNLEVDGNISNATFIAGTTLSGTNTFKGFYCIASFANSSLASGNNSAINISTNGYVQLSGPTGTFTNCGIAGGIDGRVVTLENTTAQVMWIGNQNGNDPTAANRILTMTGADEEITNNIVTFRYDATASRWKLISHN